jgi:ACS family hexuronate transporter-like MFS transporter
MADEHSVGQSAEVHRKSEPASEHVASAGGAAVAALESVNERIGRYRWVICGLLFFATTINYIDRQVIGILAGDLQLIIGWSEIDYGNIVAAFNAAYALGLLVSGRLMDRFGTKIGYAAALVIWSLAGMATALARTPFHFGVARAALGLGEAGNFPAAIKTVAEWFPKKERALATGIFNAGTNVGAIVAPLTVPWIAINLGWEWAFILTGAVGFLWLAFWIPTYRKPEEHPKLGAAERAYIQSDPSDPPSKIPWLQLIPHRQTCAFAIGKYMTDPIWWFYLYWIPNFLRQKHGLDLSTVGPPLIAIYLIADVGSIGGGWLSSSFIKRGWSINRSRKIAMLICALSVVPVVFVSQVTNLWVAVSLIGLAAAAHQGWSANIFTTASDMFPRRAVGSVVGIGGMAGALGGATMAVATGYILESTGQNYMLIFLIAGFAYLAALGVIHLLSPKLQPLDQIDSASINPVSIGSIVGFGFIGLMFGTFGGWVFGLVTRAAGKDLFLDMISGAGIGAVIGIVVGFIICSRLAKKAAP